MAVTFTRAETVNPGDPITARQLRSLVRAFNDRILWSIGDSAWRIAWGISALWRQMRNPADFQGLVFPSQFESFEVFHHVEPEQDYQYPLTGPGEPEGSNLGNPLNQFVFGNPALDNEENRLNSLVPLWLGTPPHPPTTPEEMWTLGKMQRGCIEPETGLQNVPALEAAQSIFQIVTPTYSPHGKSYGGYFPSPVELLTDCGDFENSGLGISSYEIKFTALREDVSTAGFHGSLSTVDGKAVITYAGTCPLGTDYTAEGHIVGMARLPFATLVAVNDGAGGYNVDSFPVADWIEGPYEGEGLLDHDDGQQINRAVWRFCLDFRGTPEQRKPDDFKIEEIAFDFQAFTERPYYLAPAAGRFSGDSLEAIYPTAQINLPANAGAVLQFDDGQSAHTPRSGFIFIGYFAKATKLAARTAVEAVDSTTGEVIASSTLDPDQDGNASALLFMEEGQTDAFFFRLNDLAASTGAGGALTVECAELLSYHPNWWDFYLLLRMSATDGGDLTASGVDGRGLDFDQALELWENYRDAGCIINGIGAGLRMTPDWVNDNPIYDAARRAAREMVRILPRRQFVSYEVSGGKSILRFLRYVDVPGLPGGTFDCFADIAPSATPVEPGELIEDEVYVVRGTGTVSYRGSNYSDGQSFTADATADFTADEGTSVFVKDGIRAKARKKGWSNRWCSFIQTKCYHPSESSIWKPEAYGDYFAWNQRCHFYSGSAGNARFRRHTTFNYRTNVTERDDGSGYDTELVAPSVQAQYISPEAPSGYNYADGANDLRFGSTEFFESCQIYQAPYEIESATVEFDGLGREIVKLVFNRRFDSHPDAPASFGQDPLSWDADALRAESYRTDDNAIREYALHQVDPSYQCVFRTGDSGTNSAVSFLPDNPFGSCFPHFFFVKLIPEPWEDDNESFESSDSRAVVDPLTQAETYLHYMCEGFIDDKTSLEITCKTGFGNLYDYRYKNLCFDAFGGASIGAFSLDVRADGPHGYGPLPNPWMYAEVFNRLAKAVNLLTRARVMLPFEVQCKTQNFSGTKEITPDWPTDMPVCSEGKYTVVWAGSPPDAGTLDSEDADWVECGLGASASSSGGIDLDNCTGSNGFLAYTHRQVTAYRVQLTTGYELAIPAAWRDQVASIGGFVGIYQSSTQQARCNDVTSADDADGCCPDYQTDPGLCGPDWWDTDLGKGWGGCGPYPVEEIAECRMLSAGTLDPGTPPDGAPFVGGHNTQSPPVRCGNSSGKSISISVLNDPGFFVTIPLVDLES